MSGEKYSQRYPLVIYYKIKKQLYTSLKIIPPFIRFSQISIHACSPSHQTLASFKALICRIFLRTKCAFNDHAQLLYVADTVHQPTDDGSLIIEVH